MPSVNFLVSHPERLTGLLVAEAIADKLLSDEVLARDVYKRLDSARNFDLSRPTKIS